MIEQASFTGNEAMHTGGGGSFVESAARSPVAIRV